MFFSLSVARVNDHILLLFLLGGRRRLLVLDFTVYVPFQGNGTNGSCSHQMPAFLRGNTQVPSILRSGERMRKGRLASHRYFVMSPAIVRGTVRVCR